MQDGTFLRLKSMEIGYTLPAKLLQRFKVENLRIYLAGTNLLTFSSFKLWDPEMGGNGLGYPTQRVFSAGLQVSRSEEHTSELQSLMRISYAVFCLKKKKIKERKQILNRE